MMEKSNNAEIERLLNATDLEDDEYENVSKAGTRPLMIEGGAVNKRLYAGFNNLIQIVFDGEDASDLIVYTTGGRLDTVDKVKGTYFFVDKLAGSIVEVTAENPTTGVRATQSFDVVEIPAPDAYVWKSATALRKKLSFSATEFKKQNAVILSFDAAIPVMCTATSFEVVRIDTKGKRTVLFNKQIEGVFLAETQRLINKAKTGDVYIFRKITSNCTIFPIRDIVYIIQ